MLLLEQKATQMDDLLDKMAEGIQLDATRRERMKTAYEAVKDWIEGDEVFFKPFKYDVYPHGSVRILTTVKPINKEEFDLDIAIHLKTGLRHTPQEIYRHLKRRLEEHDTYKRMLEAKNRCIRLNYAGDFHMDILPGVQEYTWDENRLRVPDRELGHWVSSSPRGYANWFTDQANRVQMSLLEKALRAENLPADNFDKKKPLQRAVQLIKRYRDVYFQDNYKDYKTSSIILTTIAGQFYAGQDSIFNTIDGIVSTIRNKVVGVPSRLKVVNPVNSDEDFTDKWEGEQEYYVAFQAFSIHLHNEWQQLKRHHGVINEGRILKSLFGENLFSEAQRHQTDEIGQLRNSNQLGVNRSTGILSSLGVSATAIKSNTFYGE